jgi:Leucine-rich repeat (LRR) protein
MNPSTIELITKMFKTLINMKSTSFKILFAIIMMMAGITAQAANVITMTTSKKAGDEIYLDIPPNENYTVSGADRIFSSNYTLTSSTVTITGDVTKLSCEGNSLTSLDVSGDTLLTELFCYANSLTSLDVSKCTKLTILSCSYNSLTKLDVSNCTKLTWLDCEHNKLTELDVSNSNKLERIYCEGNNLGRGQMGWIVNLLADRTATTAGEFDVFDPAGDSNTIFMTQVAAAKAKNWKVQSYDGNTGNYADYEGLSTFTLTTKKAVGSVLNCKIALNGSSTALLMKGATYTAPNSDYTYSCTLDATTVKIDGDIKLLECENGSLTSLVANQAIYANSISCLNNYLRGAAMDALISSLPDRNSSTPSGSGAVVKSIIPVETTYGMLKAVQNGADIFGVPIVENNVITRKQVAAAKAKNWKVYAMNYFQGTTMGVEYSGADPVISMGGARKAGDEMIVDYTVDGEDSISGATGNKYGDYTLSSDTMKVAGVVTQFICSGNGLKWLKVSDNTALEWLNCSENAIEGANMDALISSLPERRGRDAGTLVAIYIGSGENNVCTTTQVAAAKAKNWNVKLTDGTDHYSDYAGSTPTTGTERIADDGNAAIVAIYNVNGMKLAQPQPGLNILKMSNGTVKKLFLKE